MTFRTYRPFSPYARELRKHFDRRMRDPHVSTADRFVWDYWHIPDEYTFLRTPAWEYFPRGLYQRFHRHLVEWGRTHLGCHDISPTWLSNYVEGCQQSLHRDAPHGPLAFVLSLTDWEKRPFRGGETLIKKSAGFHRIPARFNQLLLFNPNVPHAVNRVRDNLDPRRGRLVLHGWFVQPRVFWYGSLKAAQVASVLDTQLPELIADVPEADGYGGWRLHIGADGAVEKAHALIETWDDPKLSRLLAVRIRRLKFPRRRSRAVLTLPLLLQKD